MHFWWQFLKKIWIFKNAAEKLTNRQSVQTNRQLPIVFKKSIKLSLQFYQVLSKNYTKSVIKIEKVRLTFTNFSTTLSPWIKCKIKKYIYSYLISKLDNLYNNTTHNPVWWTYWAEKVYWARKTDETNIRFPLMCVEANLRQTLNSDHFWTLYPFSGVSE